MGQENENLGKVIDFLKTENDRLHHLTNVLIDHLWKIGDKRLPLKDIDKRMEEYDKKQSHIYRDVLSGEEL